MNIFISPFHLLNILKDYGEGTELFQPDLKSKSDYYFLGNAIIYKDVEHIAFVVKNDEICDPCIYFINETCTDVIDKGNIKINKNNYYTDLNRKLFNNMNIKENYLYNFYYIINYINKIINIKIINICWPFNSKEQNIKILNNIRSALKKLIITQ